MTPSSNEIYSMLMVGFSVLLIWGGVAFLVVTLLGQ